MPPPLPAPAPAPNDALSAELLAQVAARAKAAMQEHSRELQERVAQADRQRQLAESRVTEVQAALRARDAELAQAREQTSEARAALKRGQVTAATTTRADAQLGNATEAQRAELAASHTRCEELEESLHAADARARDAALEWVSKCSDLEATLSDEQARRKSAESTLHQIQGRVGQLSSESTMARNEVEEISRRHRAELQALRESLHSEVLTEQTQREKAEKRETQSRLQLERLSKELAQTKAALSRTVESHARAQGDTKSSSEDALLQESMRVKSAELSATRARQALADKEDELVQMSAQLQHVMAELSQVHDETTSSRSSSHRTVTELEAQVREAEKQSAAREQEWVDKTGKIVAQTATLKQERDAMQAELADAHRLRELETTAAAALRAEVNSHESELAKARTSASEALEAGVRAREALRKELGGEISSLKLELQDARLRKQAAERDAQTARAELARTLNSLEVAQRSLEEQTRAAATNVASLRTAATAADSRLVDLSEHCEALEGERDRALRQVESSVARMQSLTAERDLSTKVARESVENAERKCALQTEALARSEARAAAAESRLQAEKEDAEAAREEDRAAICRAAAIRESLEAEVGGLKADIEGLEHLNATLKSQVVVVETEARRMQLRFAQASAKLGVPLSPAQQSKLQRDVDGAMRTHNSVAAGSLNLPPKSNAPAPISAAAGSGAGAQRTGAEGGKLKTESWSEYYSRTTR